MLQCITRTASLQPECIHVDTAGGMPVCPSRSSKQFVTVLLTARQKATSRTDLDVVPDNGSAAFQGVCQVLGDGITRWEANIQGTRS